MTTLANLSRNNGSTMPTTVRRIPFAEMLGVDSSDLFNNFYASLSFDAHAAQGGPNISRTENGYLVEISVAGYKPDQIDVTYKDGVLSVSGKNVRRTFSRSLVLPDEIDPDQVKAHVEDGLLTLTLRRRPEAEPKRIQITVN